MSAVAVHNYEFRETPGTDPDLTTHVRDLVRAESALLQGMPVIGPWFEARILDIVRQHLPVSLKATGAVQLFDPSRPTLRTRSWDIAVFDPKALPSNMPPAASKQDGPPLLPRSACRLVIDTKTIQCDVRKYCQKEARDKSGRHDETELQQLSIIGPSVRKLLVFGKVTGSPMTLHRTAAEFGVDVLCLSKMTRQGRIENGCDRRTTVISPLTAKPPCLGWQNFINLLSGL